MKDKYSPIVKSIIAQEKWRQNQIATYYGTGRPLYKNYEDRIDQPIIPNKLFETPRNKISDSESPKINAAIMLANAKIETTALLKKK